MLPGRPNLSTSACKSNHAFEQANHDFASEIKAKPSIEPPGFWAPRRCARPARGRHTPDRWNRWPSGQRRLAGPVQNRGAVPRALGTSSRPVEQNATAILGATGRQARQCIDAFLRRVRGIPAVEGDLGHQSLRQAVYEHIGASWMFGRIAAEALPPVQVAGKQLFLTRLGGVARASAPDRARIEVDEDTLAKLFDCR
jgi:hypothetical protein